MYLFVISNHVKIANIISIFENKIITSFRIMDNYTIKKTSFKH